MSTTRALGRHRRGLATASLLLALTSLAACGGDEDPASAETTPSGSADSAPAASAAPAEDAEDAEEVEDADDPAPRTAGEKIDTAEFLEVFETAVDQATSAEIGMEQSASGLTGTGVLDYDSDPVAMQMTATLDSMGEIEMRLVDNVMYMLLPMLGDKFIAMDLDDPSNPLGGSFADYLDPASMLTTFADGIESVTFVGEEDVDSEPMDHYTVVSDPSAMLADLELPEGAPSVDLPDTQIIDIWFDADGFFRRVVTDMGSLGTTTMTYDDWGTDVSVEAPPTDQVTTMPGAPAGA